MAYTEITPIYYPLEFTYGDDWIRDIPVVIDDDDTLMNFEGWTATANVRRKSQSASTLLSFSTYALTLMLTEGNIHLELLKEETTDIEAAEYVWDCTFIDSDGKTRTLIKESSFKVNKNI